MKRVGNGPDCEADAGAAKNSNRARDGEALAVVVAADVAGPHVPACSTLILPAGATRGPHPISAGRSRVPRMTLDHPGASAWEGVVFRFPL